MGVFFVYKKTRPGTPCGSSRVGASRVVRAMRSRVWRASGWARGNSLGLVVAREPLRESPSQFSGYLLATCCQSRHHVALLSVALVGMARFMSVLALACCQSRQPVLEVSLICLLQFAVAATSSSCVQLLPCSMVVVVNCWPVPSMACSAWLWPPFSSIAMMNSAVGAVPTSGWPPWVLCGGETAATSSDFCGAAIATEAARTKDARASIMM